MNNNDCSASQPCDAFLVERPRAGEILIRLLPVFVSDSALVDVARELGPRGAKRLAKSGECPTFREGRRILARRADFDAWIARRCAEHDGRKPGASSTLLTLDTIAAAERRCAP